MTSQLTRSRVHNLADAREKLAALVRRALVPVVPRVATLPTVGGTEQRLRAKRPLAAKKAARRWESR